MKYFLGLESEGRPVDIWAREERKRYNSSIPEARDSLSCRGK